MPLSLLLGFLAGDKRPVIGEIKLDASIKEEHKTFNQVTRYPVEDGAELTDNIRSTPDRIMINGIVTNTPISILPTAGLQALFDKRALTAYQQLRRIAGRERDDLTKKLKPPILVKIVTQLDMYDNMALERLSIPRDKTTGDTFQFTAEFVKIEKSSNASVSIPAANLASGVADLAQSGQDVGRQATTPASGEADVYGSALWHTFHPDGE